MIERLHQLVSPLHLPTETEEGFLELVSSASAQDLENLLELVANNPSALKLIIDNYQEKSGRSP
jgi:hypothetical protein